MEEFYTDAGPLRCAPRADGARVLTHSWCARRADDSRKCHDAPDPDAQAFKAYVKMVLTRKNTITGVMYNEDPGAPPEQP